MTAGNNTRIFFVGGVIAYRALFNWLNPWIFVPTLIVTPIFQLLFFAFLGRAAGLENDRFYVIGNALQVGALPGLFAMTFAIAGERWFQTLSPVLATPANRAAIFLGRARPARRRAGDRPRLRRARVPVAPSSRGRGPPGRDAGEHVRLGRLVWTGFITNLKMLGTSSFFLLTSIAQPIIFATIAYYMFKSGGQKGTLLYSALGAGMMGVWSTTLFGSGGMIQWQRWQGTLELSVASPPPMVLVYFPFSIANAFTGAYALA